VAADNALPKLEGVLNFRELGGLEGAGGTIRSGVIFRSGHWSTATDGDLQVLADAGIETIVDLRLDTDRAGDGGDNRVAPDVEVIKMPMVDSSGHSGEIREVLMSGDRELMIERYGDGKAHQMAIDGAVAQAREPEKREVYARFLDHVATTEAPLLFHCSAGKDRAGWAATVIGMALGVNDDDLVEHYLLSNVHRSPEARRDYYASKGIDVDVVMPFLGVHADYITGALAAVDEDFSSREAYLTEALGFGPERVEQLRAKYLT